MYPVTSMFVRRMLHSTASRYAVTPFRMPAMSPTMSEGGIASWNVREGDSFSAGDVLLEIETDKATIDVEAQDDGILAKVLIPEGSKNVPVGKNIALLAEEGDDISNIEVPQDALSAPREPTPATGPPVNQETKSLPTRPSHTPPMHLRPLFPSVQRLLLEHNVDKPNQIVGTGVRGMLTKGDVLAFLGKASSPTGTFKHPKVAQATTQEDSKPLDGLSLRKLIVSSMLQSTIKAKASQTILKEVDFESIVSDYLPAKIAQVSKAAPAKNYFEEGLVIRKGLHRTVVMPQDHEHSLSVLKASTHDVRYLVSLFRGVNFTNRATVTVTSTGITITVEEAHALLGTAFIFASLFDEYIYHRPRLDGSTSSQSTEVENTAFEIPLNTVIDCLNIFGSAGMSSSTGGAYKKWKTSDEGSENGDAVDDANDARKNVAPVGRGIEAYFGGASEKRTSMRLSYAGPGYPLTLILAEDASGPTTTCEIMTFEPEPMLDLDFDNSRLLLKIILKSSWLREALMEIDLSCEKITFISNPPGETTSVGLGRRRPLEKPILRIQAEGAFGSTQLDYPNDKDVLETFECAKPLEFSYRFAHINRTLRALQNSMKTSLRIDDEGLLSLQFLMPSPKVRTSQEEQPPAFIEFRCLALDEHALE